MKLDGSAELDRDSIVHFYLKSAVFDEPNQGQKPTLRRFTLVMMLTWA